MQIFVAIIEDILSSHDKNQMHVHNHARVHTAVINILETGNPSISITKIHSLLERISSWWLLNQENAHACVCEMENFYAMPVHLF